MIYKEVKNAENSKMALIARVKSAATGAYDYYITIFTWSPMVGGFWAVNDNYAQKVEINSAKEAMNTARKLVQQ